MYLHQLGKISVVCLFGLPYSQCLIIEIFVCLNEGMNEHLKCARQFLPDCIGVNSLPHRTTTQECIQVVGDISIVP